MRILYVTETFLPKIDGVVTRLTKTLDELERLGHEAIILCPKPAPKHYRSFPVIGVRATRFWGVYPTLRLGLPNPVIGKILDHYKPDLVHLINPIILGKWAQIATNRRGIALANSFHTDVPEYARRLWWPWLEKPAMWWIAHTHIKSKLNLVTSPQMKDRLQTFGVDDVKIWRKAVDTNLFRPSARSSQMRARLTDNHPEDTLLTYIGRVSHEKNIADLVPVIKHFQGSNIRLAIIGEGPKKDDIVPLFAGTKTHFEPFLQGEELASAYASGDIFVFPSTSETLGFAAMESMSSGVPVVGARAGGLPNVIEDGENSLLFEANNPQSLIAQIQRLLDNKALYEKMCENGRQSMLPYSWKAATTQLVELYENALYERN